MTDCFFPPLPSIPHHPVYGKPVLPPSSTCPSPLPFLQGGPAEREDEPDSASGEALPPDSPAPLPGSAPPSVDTLPRPLSPTKLTPVAHSPLRYQNDELEALRRRLANAPRPLKKRSSITEPEGPGGPNIQKLLYQRFNTLAGGMDGGMPFYQPGLPDYVGGAIADMDNSNTANANVPEAPSVSAAALPEPPCPAPDANDNQPPPPPTGDPPASPPPQASDTSQDESNNNPPEPSDSAPSPIPEAPSPEEAGTPPKAATPPSQPAVSMHHSGVYGDRLYECVPRLTTPSSPPR